MSAFAGSELWLPDELLRRLRDYAADGGRVAVFGADSFKRAVTLRGEVLSDPSPPGRENALGERTERRAHERGAAHASSRTSLGLFEGVSGFVGEFTVFEPSRGLPAVARAGSARRAAIPASRRSSRSASAAASCCGPARRSGRASWRSRRLSLELPQVTKRIWNAPIRRTPVSRLPSCGP